MTLDIDLDALTAEELAARLSAPPAERAAFVRAAAEAGIAEAQAVYGQMLLDGAGVEADPRAAFAWFSKAAGAGHAMAINMVGRCYDLGWGVPVDKAASARWFRAAAERGLEWGLYNYATSLALGAGVPEDRPAALDLFRQAAALGNAKSMNYIGSFHEDGWVVARDLAAAKFWYAGAADGGDFRGQFNLARLLADEGRIDEALGWLRRVPETAHAAFLAKAAAWLSASPHEALRDAAVDYVSNAANAID